MRSVEYAECGICGVWTMRRVEDAECGVCGVWKMRNVENNNNNNNALFTLTTKRHIYMASDKLQ